MANYLIEDVEGIGPVMGEKLRGEGLSNTDKMLVACKTRKQREQLAAKTEIREKLILKFANMVDLYRVQGIGSGFSGLLEAAGVESVPELGQRMAANLLKTMELVNAERKLARPVPTLAEVAKWIEEAKKLPRALEY